MIKLIIVGRRRAGMTRGQMSRHLRKIHGPMVYDAPADAGAMPARYVQNHVFDGIHLGGAGEASQTYGIDRDLVTEVWFSDVGTMIASTQTPYYLANLKPDEPRFVDDPTVVRCLVEEGVREGGASAGRFKLFIFLKRSAAEDIETATVKWRTALSPALNAAGAGWMENVVRGRSSEPVFAERIWEAWFDSRDALSRFVDEVLPGSLQSLVDASDPTIIVFLLAEEYTAERLRAGD